jgi:hypothetical protein
VATLYRPDAASKAMIVLLGEADVPDEPTVDLTVCQCGHQADGRCVATLQLPEIGGTFTDPRDGRVGQLIAVRRLRDPSSAAIVTTIAALCLLDTPRTRQTTWAIRCARPIKAAPVLGSTLPVLPPGARWQSGVTIRDITPTKRAEMIAQHSAGKSACALARELGVSDSTISRWLSAWGVQGHPAGPRATSRR